MTHDEYNSTGRMCVHSWEDKPRVDSTYQLFVATSNTFIFHPSYFALVHSAFQM